MKEKIALLSKRGKKLEKKAKKMKANLDKFNGTRVVLNPFIPRLKEYILPTSERENVAR